MVMVSPDDVAKVSSALRHLTLADDHLRRAVAARLSINVTELVASGHLAESEELTPTQLAQLLGLTTASVTVLVDHLEAAGFVFRTRSIADRRSLWVRLTPAGVRATQWVHEQYHAAITQAFEQGGAALAPDVAVFLEQTSQTLAKAAALAQPEPDPRPRR